MQLSWRRCGVAMLMALVAEPVPARCPIQAMDAARTSGFAQGWQLIETIGEEREVSRLPEVREHIAFLDSGELLEASAPERIALQVGLMDSQALLEWLELRDAGAGDELPEYEWQYIGQHGYREVQRQKVRAGLGAHPGDPHLAGRMVTFEGFGSTFYREQLELALQRDSSLRHLRESLAQFLLLTEDLESAQTHIVALIGSDPECSGEDDPRLPWVLEVLAWLADHPDRCADLQVETRDRVASVFEDEPLVMTGPFTSTVIGNRLRRSPELAESLLGAMAVALSKTGCDSRLDGLD